MRGWGRSSCTQEKEQRGVAKREKGLSIISTSCFPSQLPPEKGQDSSIEERAGPGGDPKATAGRKGEKEKFRLAIKGGRWGRKGRKRSEPTTEDGEGKKRDLKKGKPPE